MKLNKLVFCAFLATLFLFASYSISVAQTNGDYRSVASGNWSTLATWQRYNNLGVGWATPTVGQGYPGFSNKPTEVTIDVGDDITLNVTPVNNLNNLTITGDKICCGFNGGTLSTNSTFSLTLNGNLTIDEYYSSISFGGSGNLTVGGNLDIQGIATLTFSSSGNLTVTGTTQFDGTFTDSNNVGISTFVGTVTGIGTWASTAVTTTGNIIFRGGITFNPFLGITSFDAGGATFNTNNQALSGDGDLSFGNNVAITSVTLTKSNTGALTISGTTTLTASGGFTDSSNNGTDTFGGNVSVGAGTSFTSTAATTTANVVFRGGITNAGTFSGGGATFNTNAQALTGASAISFANNVAINNIVVTNTNTGNFTITGTTTMTSGGYTDPNNTGINLFVGNFSQSGTSAFNTTGTTTSANLVFRGGITNTAGTFTGGGATFNTNNQALAGATCPGPKEVLMNDHLGRRKFKSYHRM